MANTKEIKDRINSIKETQKITNAMYLISSTKLRKAKKELENTEPYFYGMQAMTERLSRHISGVNSIYFRNFDDDPERERTAAFLVITADKGLAGAYNHNVLKLTEEEMSKYKNTKLFVVGELGRKYFENKHIPIDEEFLYTAQNPSLHRSRVITLRLLELYETGQIQELFIVYTIMVSNAEMQPLLHRLLPMKEAVAMSIPADVYQEEFQLVPSPEDVIKAVVPNCINGYIFSALVESFCCEQHARMTAMQSANDSANAILHSLNIQYNRVRQAAITQEITEVCSGAKAQRLRKRKKA